MIKNNYLLIPKFREQTRASQLTHSTSHERSSYTMSVLHQVFRIASCWIIFFKLIRILISFWKKLRPNAITTRQLFCRKWNVRASKIAERLTMIKHGEKKESDDYWLSEAALRARYIWNFSKNFQKESKIWVRTCPFFANFLIVEASTWRIFQMIL